ncbi:hypothetical protein MPSEU_000956600 [Mayamaea pseudoterrestris]|nr:hypothetical protein MPSEU_000956600 [Mayamaea pseudoterrestris]
MRFHMLTAKLLLPFLCIAACVHNISGLSQGQYYDNVSFQMLQTPSLKKPHQLVNPSLLHRRQVLLAITTASGLGATAMDPAHAAVTDETDRFADNWWSAQSSSSTTAAAADRPFAAEPAAASDEITVTFSKQDLIQYGGLGLELKDIEFRTNLRVFVKSVKPGCLGSKLGISADSVVVRVNNQSTERTNAEGVARMIQVATSNKNANTITMTFRDPSAFRDKLQTLAPGESVTTQVAPAGDTTQRNADGSVKQNRVETTQTDQRISVTQLVAPTMCRKGADTDDLLEISYVGRVLETGQIFDGSAVKINNQGIPGRGNDVTLYFVLNKQPFGQFPPGWDVGMYGMCVGERRRLIIPPALAYGAKGMPRRNIPPNATLQYDVSLVSLNGLSTPQ